MRPPRAVVQRTVARFGLFEIDLEKDELRRAGRLVPLQPHPFLILETLVEHEGDEVTREDLRRRLWPDQEFLDFENGINTAVGRLRQALGDSAENPRYVGTRRGRGYRLLAPVTWAGSTVAMTTVPPLEADVDGAYFVGAHSSQRRRLWWTALGAAVLALVGIALVVVDGRLKRVDQERASGLVAEKTDPLLVYAPAGENITGSFALSPTGKWLAFVTGGATPERSHLCVRALDGVEIRTLPGTSGAAMPFWSPDERSVGFFAQEHLRIVDVQSGKALTIGYAPKGRGGTWSKNDVVLFAPDLNAPILAVSARGGEPAAVTDVTGEVSHRFPFFLPDGQHFLYLALREDREQSEIRWAKLGGTEGGALGDSGSNAVYVPPGYLLFARKSVLLAQELDVSTLRLLGSPVVVREHVGVYGEDGPTGLAAFAASASGLLAVADLRRPMLRFSWFDRRGTELGSVGPVGDYLGFDLVPDASRAVAVRFDPRKRWSDLLIVDLRSGVQTQLTDDPSPDWLGPWAPGGHRVAFTSLRRGAWRAYVQDWPLVGREREIALCDTVDSWFPDGRSVVGEVNTPKGIDLVRFNLEPGADPKPILTGLTSSAVEARVSADGKWLAYASNENARGREIHVARLGTGLASSVIVLTAGTIPRWRADGRELFYLSGRTIVAVPVENESRIPFGPPKVLFEAPLPPRDSLADPALGFVVSEDGSRFLFATSIEGQSRSAIRIFKRWTVPPVP